MRTTNTLPLFLITKRVDMKKCFMGVVFIVLVGITAHAQQFSYTWHHTGIKVDVRISYLDDSSYTFISRKVTDVHSSSLLVSENDIVFFGDNIVFDSGGVTLPLKLRKYIFFPFDPSAFGIARLNNIFDDIDYLSFMLGAGETREFVSNSSKIGMFNCCSCKPHERITGYCHATLFNKNDLKSIRCTGDSGSLSSCTPWLSPLSPVWIEGGGIVVEVKGNYAHDTYIEQE
jgi:hypothetical protein